MPGSNPGWTPAADRDSPEAATTGRPGALKPERAIARRAVERGDWKPRPTEVPELCSLERDSARDTDEVGAPTVVPDELRATRAPAAELPGVRTVGAPSALREAAQPVRAVEAGEAVTSSLRVRPGGWARVSTARLAVMGRAWEPSA